MKEIIEIAYQFSIEVNIIHASELTSGTVNHTYLITCSDNAKYILQCINRNVFKNPQETNDRIHSILNTIEQILAEKDNLFPLVSFKMILTKDNKTTHYDKFSKPWRMVSYILESKSKNILNDLNEAYTIGQCLGAFHNLLSRVDFRYNVQIENYRNTIFYINLYLQFTKNKISTSEDSEFNFCINFIENEKNNILHIYDKIYSDSSLVSQQLIHNDARLENILFSEINNLPIAFIDLDTISYSKTIIDIADCIRSCCNPSGDCPETPASASIDEKLFQYLLRGYLNTNQKLSVHDHETLVDAVYLLCFELGIRWICDFLSESKYFNVPETERIKRAATQFYLALSIVRRKGEFENIIIQNLNEIKNENTHTK